MIECLLNLKTQNLQLARTKSLSVVLRFSLDGYNKITYTCTHEQTNRSTLTHTYAHKHHTNTHTYAYVCVFCLCYTAHGGQYITKNGCSLQSNLPLCEADRDGEPTTTQYVHLFEYMPIYMLLLWMFEERSCASVPNNNLKIFNALHILHAWHGECTSWWPLYFGMLNTSKPNRFECNTLGWVHQQKKHVFYNIIQIWVYTNNRLTLIKWTDLEFSFLFLYKIEIRIIIALRCVRIIRSNAAHAMRITNIASRILHVAAHANGPILGVRCLLLQQVRNS